MTTRSRAHLVGQQHTLYRFFDADGTLLYVGITVDFPGRLRSHIADKAWWPQVARIATEMHPSQQEAAAAEMLAIVAERPVHNIAGGGVDLGQLESALRTRRRVARKAAVLRLATLGWRRAGSRMTWAITAVWAVYLMWLIVVGAASYQFAASYLLTWPAVYAAALVALGLNAAASVRPRATALVAVSLPGIVGAFLTPADLGSTTSAIIGGLAAPYLVGVAAWAFAGTPMPKAAVVA